MASAIRLTALRRRFGKLQALDGVSLEVREGEIYGFLGRNGAGKTTTLKVLMGILRADSGEIELFGDKVKQITVAHKQRIGYVSQEQNFYPWMTALQLGRFVSGFYTRWDDGEFNSLLKALDVPPDRRASELSGGTRAKLGLCLAFAPRPALVLLDEPTAGLDPVARREFNDLLVQVVRERGTTAFFSSHLVAEVEQVANRVGIIQSGQMKFEGEVTTLLKTVRRVVVPVLAPTVDPVLAPTVDASMVGAPTVDAQRVNAPTAGAPTLTAPTLTAPTLTAPTVGAPTLGAPTLGAPTVAASTVNAPTVDARVPVSAPLEVPAGFSRVRGDVFQAAPALWDTAAWPEGTQVTTLDLEEAFLAFARSFQGTAA